MRQLNWVSQLAHDTRAQGHCVQRKHSRAATPDCISTQLGWFCALVFTTLTSAAKLPNQTQPTRQSVLKHSRRRVPCCVTPALPIASFPAFWRFAIPFLVLLKVPSTVTYSWNSFNNNLEIFRHFISTCKRWTATHWTIGCFSVSSFNKTKRRWRRSSQHQQWLTSTNPCYCGSVSSTFRHLPQSVFTWSAAAKCNRSTGHIAHYSLSEASSHI